MILILFASRALVARLLALSLLSAPVLPAQHNPPTAHAQDSSHAAPASALATSDHYSPYRFLLGEWEIGPEGQPPFMVMRMNFGRNESYLWYSASLVHGGTEEVHFEGMLLWNGVRGNLDLLLSLDPARGRVQERGIMRAEADGMLVREIIGTYSSGETLMWNGQRVGHHGAEIQFRQTYRAISPDEVLTVIMRKEGDSWVPTFPGSDHIIMRRKK
jgi:hypothetical protein